MGRGDTEDAFLAQEGDDQTIDEEDEDEAASWLLLNPVKNSNNQSNGYLFGGEVDEYLDLVEYNSCGENQVSSEQYNQHQQQQQHYGVPQKINYGGGDSIVPVQGGEGKPQMQQHHHHQQQQSYQLGFDYDQSSKAAYSYNGSTSHSVSFYTFVHLIKWEF